MGRILLLSRDTLAATFESGYHTCISGVHVPTEPSVSRDRVFRFGSFELSEREGELRKNGVLIKLWSDFLQHSEPGFRA